MSTDNNNNDSVELLRYSETTSFEEIDSYEEISEDSLAISENLNNDESIENVSENNDESIENVSESNSESIENVPNLPTDTVISSSNSPLEFSMSDSSTSWTETIEAFLDQLNDIDFDSDYERDILLKRGLEEPTPTPNDSEDECGDDDEVINELRSGQRFLLCLAVPVLLSQLLMLLILSSSNGSNAKSSVILHPITSIKTIHYHHHYYYDQQEEKPKKGFMYIFFNPFAAIYNCRYFKITSEWVAKEYRKQINDPNSFISHISNYVRLYLNSIKTRVLKLNNVMKSGLENEIGKALRIRDNWNRAVYNKIYEITSTPQYQRAVSTLKKWKDRLFS